MRRLLTVAEVAERWGVEEKFVRGRVASGELAVVQLSRRCVRVRLGDVEEFEEARLSVPSVGRRQEGRGKFAKRDWRS